jgi:hypothetical protein
MNRSAVACTLVLSIGSLTFACSEDEAGDDGGTGGTGGAGAMSTGGTSGSSSGGTTSGGTTSGGTTSGGTTSGGTTSGGTTSGGSTGTGGDATGGTGGSTSGGSAGTGGAAGGGATGGAGGSGQGGSGGSGSGAGGTSAGGKGGSGGSAGGANAMMNFFVTSDTSPNNGNLGGLAMADMRCQTLAAAVGHGSKTWRAYLSVAEPMTHAINRIGEGPYYNSTGAVVAMTKAALHTRAGDAALFLDERGNRVNGQWSGSPAPNQHDVLTGTQANGMLSMGNTCSDWTATTGNAQVGHSDGLGPNMATTGNFPIWNGSHTSSCGNLASTGGAGKLYCFVGP